MKTSYMSDAEMWAVSAEMLKGSQYISSGLCHFLGDLEYRGVISSKQRTRMTKLMFKNRHKLNPKLACFYAAYFWPPGDWKSRASACEQLAKLSLISKG